MDIKWKKFSYSAASKIIAFLLVIVCYSGLLTLFVNSAIFHNLDFSTSKEKSFYQSKDFNRVNDEIFLNITAVIGKYKGEENILNGNSLSSEEINRREERLYQEFKDNSRNYNPKLSQEENHTLFREFYAERIQQIKEQLIQEDLRIYRDTLKSINAYDGLFYYAQRGDTVFTNSPEPSKEFFRSQPAFMMCEGFKTEIFPEDVYFYATNQIEAKDTIYVGFTDGFLAPRIAAWEETKQFTTDVIYGSVTLALVLAITFILLLFITGRKPKDEDIHLNSSVDKIYTDINLGLCALLITAWLGGTSLLFGSGLKSVELSFLITSAIAAAGLVLVLSLVRHIKNRSFFTHSLTYNIFSRVFAFGKEVFHSGSTAVKVVLLVIFYPIIAGLTLFLFPIVIAVAAWLALQKVKEYDAVKEGVRAVKDGDLSYQIHIPGEGEFALLAADINSITDGLSKAVENRIKSERLKSELITNVSHDIRTPLTSIITYLDLLKKEQDPEKITGYLGVLEQKAQRLKILTDDLFEATKASSGNIPVTFGKIDLLSLLTQGLGEFDEQIREQNLEFKLNHTGDKVFVRADGKLLWRAIENLLLNVLKYALPDSRVYIDIMDAGSDVVLIIKNISANELNVSSDELMERFTRGDTARTTQGSGLGLSIAQSLIAIQKGSFAIEIDGDLFKAIIQLPREN